MLALIKQMLIAGAACCSTGNSVPSLIPLNDMAQLGMSISGSSIIGRTDSQGNSTFWNDEENDRKLTHSIFGGFRFQNDWQLGAELSWYARETSFYDSSESSVGIGDTNLHLSYEPSMNLWITTSVLVPTAQGMGRGQWIPSISIRKTKIYGQWDVHGFSSLNYAIGTSHSREDLGSLTVDGTFGVGLLMGAGYQWQWQKIRTGLGVGFQWEDGASEKDRFQTRNRGDKIIWDFNADLSIPVSSEFKAIISYKDQTLLGPVRNAELSRSLSLSLIKGWSL